MEGRRKGSGRPRKSENYIPPDGKRVVAFRIPDALKTELLMRAGQKGITLQAYLQLALWDFMRREAIEDAAVQAELSRLKEMAT